MSKETKPEMTAEEIIESILESLGDPINIHNHAFEMIDETRERNENR